jgi:excisionase family DNA binding protein
MEEIQGMLMTKKELCEYLKCSVGTIDNLMKEGKIKYIKLGKMVRFDKQDINKTLGVMKIRGINVIKNNQLKRLQING